MKDRILTDRIRLLLEESPTPGLEKLTEGEMQALSEMLAGFAFETYTKGEDAGYSLCLKEIEKEVAIFMEKEGIKRCHTI